MTIEELREEMKLINKRYRDDPEICHTKIDRLLLEYVDDTEVKELYNEIRKWYA